MAGGGPDRRRSELRLAPAVTSHEVVDGDRTLRPESHFLDLVVDGRSLRSVPGAGTDMVPELNRPWLPHVPEAVERLLDRRRSDELSPGRVALLVCVIDGDLGCGQLTAALEVDEDRVTWRDFRWENGRDQPHPVEGLHHPLTFDRTAYEEAFAGAYERLAALPYEEASHAERGCLWPWQGGWRLPRREKP